MKILLSWVFDHIQSDTSQLNPDDIVSKLSTNTTEIAQYTKIKRKSGSCRLVRVKKIDPHFAICTEVNSEISHNLPLRLDLALQQLYLVILDPTGVARWGSMASLGGAKVSLLPALIPSTTPEHLNTMLSKTEFLLEIDNNAISHRPDLWSHRGFAREITALFGLTLRPIDSLIVSRRIIIDAENAQATNDSPFSLTLEAPTSTCSRIAGLFVSDIHNQPSTLDIASRLSLLDCRPINTLVDVTNYVMFDLGHPIHAYDAHTLSQKRIVVRMADAGSKITLLDGDTIALHAQDLIVADGLEPIALAGIIGGADSAVTETTESLFVEAAHFSPSIIRATSLRHKKRTEASTRFEKNIDPNQNIIALCRYLFLLDAVGVRYTASPIIQSVGAFAKPLLIRVTHEFIERRLGRSIQGVEIQKILVALGFEVQKQDGAYSITVPTFRATRDITLPEDIVEEIGRMLGYLTGPLELPRVKTTPKDTNALFQMRAIKSLMSFGFLMRELYTYSIADELFLKKIGYVPKDPVSLLNPVSAHQTHLVTSLIPNLLQAIIINSEKESELRLYEIGRVFTLVSGTVQEQQKLAAVWFSKKGDLEFYEGKRFIERLFSLIHLSVEYLPLETIEYTWQEQGAAARIMHNAKIIGTCGIINDALTKNIFEQGNCFYVECDAEIMKQQAPQIRYEPLSKYPIIIRDISLLAQKTMSAAQVKTLIQQSDTLIRSVELIDFFEKSEWPHVRALTFRMVIQNNEKTMISEEVDALIARVVADLKTQGMEIR